MPFTIGLLILLTLLLIAVMIAWRITLHRANTVSIRNLELSDELHKHAGQEVQIAGFRTLSEAAFNALILVDAHCNILHINTVARDLFNYDERTLPSQGSTLIQFTRDIEFEAHVNKALETGEEVLLQLTIGDRVFRGQALPIATSQGTLAAISLEDVSELQRLGRSRRDLVANISHELRTPITSIRLMSDTLLRDQRVGRKQRHRIYQKIATETDTLEQIAQELLDLSMIESGRAEFILTKVPLTEMVQVAVDHLDEQAQRKEITINAAIPPEVKVFADASQVQRVLGNLLHNAIKFTPAGGYITIAVRSQDSEWITVSVADTGPGIPPKERERVFERFYSTNRVRSGGTGLGLAIAKHIIQAHGGHIWVEEPTCPTPPCTGANLCFTLPCSD